MTITTCDFCGCAGAAARHGMDVCERCETTLERAVTRAMQLPDPVAAADVPDLSMDDMEVSVRTYNALRRYMDRTPSVAEFLNLERPKRIKNFGAASFRGLVQELLDERIVTKDVLVASRVWKTAPRSWRNNWLMRSVLGDVSACLSH